MYDLFKSYVVMSLTGGIYLSVILSGVYITWLPAEIAGNQVILGLINLSAMYCAGYITASWWERRRIRKLPLVMAEVVEQ